MGKWIAESAAGMLQMPWKCMVNKQYPSARCLSGNTGSKTWWFPDIFEQQWKCC